MMSGQYFPYAFGLESRYNGRYNAKRSSDVKQIAPKAGPSSDKRLKLAFFEVGIASNRRSACCGEYVPRVLYTPPVKP